MIGRRTPIFTVALVACCALCYTSAWALQRTLKSKAHNYPKAPVEVRHSQVSLVETFTSPSQLASSRAGRPSTIAPPSLH